MAFNLDLEDDRYDAESRALVATEGKLPYKFQVPTSKLLDVIVALSPRGRKLTGKQRKNFRQTINQKLYNKTRPGFYLEVGEILHIGYAGQPGSANTQHQWRIFCGDELKAQIETLLAGSALAVSEPQQSEHGASGDHLREWGGLYLRSEAEVRIAKALDETGLLFFANARGRVGLKETLMSDSQLTGRVAGEFMVFYQGRCAILKVDDQNHFEDERIIRDYARDRVLLQSGVPTVRFVVKDCLERPQDVVCKLIST